MKAAPSTASGGEGAKALNFRFLSVANGCLIYSVLYQYKKKEQKRS
ncbi:MULTISPECIES: hypothetical protein [Nostocales]|uniref:Uncharacterized protein n=3 Tax=Nostocales TaxID=1161 RepID=A0A8S9SZI9_9CYAN|nr:hypothetical protein [Tolypothrix bouteillei]KAF3884834.1 hypothetical protein DA73_0400004740 [Tolypothrix bouteillei VB521301]